MKFKPAIILFCVTFALKIGLAFYFAQTAECFGADNGVKNIYPFVPFGKISFGGGDTYSYLGAMDNLLEQNEYYFWNGERKVYAGRMPYYGVPYFLLRSLFDKFLAGDLLVVIQIFLSSLATILLAQLCSEILKSNLCFWFCYSLYFLSFNFLALDLMLVPESLSLSFLIFFLYAYHRHRIEKQFRAIFVASVFLAFLTLLKPYFVLLYPLFFLDFAIGNQIFTPSNWKSNFSNLTVKSIVLALPLILLLLPWAARNFVVLDKIIFSQENVYAGYKYKRAELAFRRFTYAWGSDFIFWNPQSRNPTYYFLKEHSEIHDQIKLPQHAITQGYSMEEIERVRQDYLQLQEHYSFELDDDVTARFDRLTSVYKNEKPFMYYVGSGFISAKKILLHTNSQFLLLFINPKSACYSGWQAVFRIVNSGIYLITILFGFAGIAVLTIKRKIGVIFAVIPLFLILFFGFYDRHAEGRYFIQGFPVLLLGAIFILYWFSSKHSQFIKRVFFFYTKSPW